MNDFADAGVEGPEDVREIFERNFRFGCEADDPINATGFDTRVNPLGAKLRAIFSSDIGHWDVPDMREVLEEAWELVDRGLIDESDFREFTFSNAATLYAEANPRFFDGTVVEKAVAEQMA